MFFLNFLRVWIFPIGSITISTNSDPLGDIAAITDVNTTISGNIMTFNSPAYLILLVNLTSCDFQFIYEPLSCLEFYNLLS